VEGGAFQSKSLARLSKDDAIFVFLHQTRPDTVKSYKLITEEYLEESFNHPAYLYFRPDGTEFDKKERMHHMAITAQRAEKVLKKISKEWGRSLKVKDYEKALETIKSAEELLVAENWEEASGLLSGVTRLRARCGVKDRAKAILSTIEARKRLLADWRAIEELPRLLQQRVEQTLKKGDPAGALRLLRKERSDLVPVAEFEKQVIAHLRETIRLEPLRFDKVLLSTGILYQLKACWATDLPEFDGLAIQISYRTDREKTLESYGIYNDVRPYGRHRAASSLTARDLHYAEVVNGRVQLWIADVLLHEALLKESPAEFPPETSHVMFGPDLLSADESLSSGAKAEVKVFKVGRYKPGT
jgi:hypothetical protein